MKSSIAEIIHTVKSNPDGLANSAIEDFEIRYDSILKLADDEYCKYPPSELYPDGFNLFKRLRKYKHNHLLFLHHPEVDYTNNLSERCLRKFKRKQKQAVTFRSMQALNISAKR